MCTWGNAVLFDLFLSLLSLFSSAQHFAFHREKVIHSLFDLLGGGLRFGIRLRPLEPSGFCGVRELLCESALGP